MPLILDTPSESSVDTEPDLVEERRRLHHDADVVIVGAGILGSALAFALGEQGRSVMLLEKSLKEPDRIVGELLQPGGVQALEELGLRHCLEDIDAIKVKGYGVSYYNQLVHIPYPANAVDQPSTKSEKEDPPLKAEGRSFHHGRFVSKLRAAAMKHPNVTVFETEVTGIVESEFTAQVIGVQSMTKKTQLDYFFADLTVICDGYASKVSQGVFTTYSYRQVKVLGYGTHRLSAPLSGPWTRLLDR